MRLRIWRAMSSPTPTRPTGRAAAVLASISRRASSGIAARIGVSMIPGETALTRTGASSSASARASDSSAPLAALTIAEFGRGRTLRKPDTSVSDLALRHLGGRKTKAGGTTNDDDFLACKQHGISFSVKSGVLIARADAGLALAEPGQFPNARARRIDVGGDIDIDQIGLVGRDALAD